MVGLLPHRKSAAAVTGQASYPASTRYTPAVSDTTEFKTVDLNTRAVSDSSRDNSYNDLQVYYEPPKPSRRQRHRLLFSLVRGVSIFCLVAVLLAIPIIITQDARESRDGDDNVRQTKNLVFYIFLLLLTTWAISGLFYLIAMALPFTFRFIAHYVNPAQKKYWRVFVMLRNPITFLFAVIAGYISLNIWFWDNDQISSFNNAAGETIEDQEVNQVAFADTINTTARILLYLILWAGAYFVEKVLMVYLTLHYHYRTNHHEILRSKDVMDTLVGLFDYSNFAYPRGHTAFAVEDHAIYSVQRHGKSGVMHSTVNGLNKISGNFAQAFGIVFGSEDSSHWLSPRSSYAIVQRALGHPASSAALAKRIWMSLVLEDKIALTVDDIKDAFGPKQHAVAVKYFRVLDENENGDVRLEEMIPSIVEAGIKRQNIYDNMGNITHVINTLDWICLGWLAMVMLGLVLISEIDLLKQLKEILGFVALGLSLVVGRTMNELVQGAIFTILDHPYDVGDVVEIFTMSETNKSLLSVKRISLLYTLFEEIGSGKQVQYANMRSKVKRITNLTRSGKNREGITLGVDFDTSFADLQLLKQELQTFVEAPENSRDYYPDLGLRVTSLCDLGRLELRISFCHKSNWSNEGLRAMRSSRFHCAVVAAVRRVPIAKPGGSKSSSGSEGKPAYTVMITDAEAEVKRAEEKERQAAKRVGYIKPEPKEEDTSGMTAKELMEAETKVAEAKTKADKKAEKEAKEKASEDQAFVSLLGLDRELSERNATATSRSFDVDDLRSFAFVSGSEKGLRRGGIRSRDV